MTLNQHSSVGRAIQVCGGKNIFAHTMEIAPHISLENILYRNPGIILISKQNINQSDWVKEWLKFPQLKAVKNHYIFFINSELLERYSPRLLIGIKKVCQDIEKARNDLN